MTVSASAAKNPLKGEVSLDQSKEQTEPKAYKARRLEQDGARRPDCSLEDIQYSTKNCHKKKNLLRKNAGTATPGTPKHQAADANERSQHPKKEEQKRTEECLSQNTKEGH